MSQFNFGDVIDKRAMEVFTTAIREMGGPGTLVERGELEMLPSLLESAYILVLEDEGGRSREEIATTLGLSRGSVDSVFDAPMEAAINRIRYAEDRGPEFDRHTAPEWAGQPMTGRQELAYLTGALAKFAYDVVKRGRHRPPA